MEYNTEIVRDVVPATLSPTPTPASSPVGEHEPEVDEENLDADHDDVPLRVRAIDDLIGDVEPPGLTRHVLNTELNFTSAEEPISASSWLRGLKPRQRKTARPKTREAHARPGRIVARPGYVRASGSLGALVAQTKTEREK
jgi:hypothetical protein